MRTIYRGFSRWWRKLYFYLLVSKCTCWVLWSFWDWFCRKIVYSLKVVIWIECPWAQHIFLLLHFLPLLLLGIPLHFACNLRSADIYSYLYNCICCFLLFVFSFLICCGRLWCSLYLECSYRRSWECFYWIFSSVGVLLGNMCWLLIERICQCLSLRWGRMVGYTR